MCFTLHTRVQQRIRAIGDDLSIKEKHPVVEGVDPDLPLGHKGPQSTR